MQAEKYIGLQSIDRQRILLDIHNAIIKHDQHVQPVVEPMMGKEMIVYKEKGMMKYALASPQKHMSLHVLPMYMNPAIYNKYLALLPEAKFQKGCINFNSKDYIPISLIQQLVTDCSPIYLVKIREDQLKSKRSK